jgi:hypothetical protein
MKEPALLLILIVAWAALQSCTAVASSPHLVVSSVHGALEVDRPSSLFIEIRNNAAPADQGLEAGKAQAYGIQADLNSIGDRIEVISRPQSAGSLGPGENRTLAFVALATGGEVGVYPLELHLSYSRLSEVAISGEQSMPDLKFVYENAAQILHLEARVDLGPRIEISEVRGKAYPGRESDLEVILANRGDEPALEVQLVASSHWPLNTTGTAEVVKRLDPQTSLSYRLAVIADPLASPGLYALPCNLTYRAAEISRKDDLAILVQVEGDSWWRLAGIALLVLVLAGAGLAGRKYLRKGRGRWRR